MPEKTCLTFITTLTDLRGSSRGSPQRASRCVGYLKNKDEAIKAVESNAGDIHEAGTYPLCVLETMDEGIYPIASPVDWFAWDANTEGYARIDGPPEDLQGIFGFSLG